MKFSNQVLREDLAEKVTFGETQIVATWVSVGELSRRREQSAQMPRAGRCHGSWRNSSRASEETPAFAAGVVGAGGAEEECALVACREGLEHLRAGSGGQRWGDPPETQVARAREAAARAGQEQGRSSRGLCFSAGEAAAFKTNREWGVSGEGEARAFGLGNS